MFDLSKDWYNGRFDEDWDPPTTEEAEATFASHGLTGDFWSLSETDPRFESPRSSADS